MYKKGSVQVGLKMDTQTDNYDQIYGAYLPHSCNQWVIGGKQEVESLILDLQQALKLIEIGSNTNE